MKSTTAILLSAVIIVTIILLGHFYPPSGLLLMPVVMSATTGLICYSTIRSGWAKVLLSYLFIACIDVGIKLYAGGIHDAQGQGVTTLLFLTGLVVATILVIAGLKPKKLADVVLVVLFVAVSIMHFLFFADLGLDPRYI